MRVKVSKRRKLAVRVALVGAGFMTFGLAGSVLLTSGLFGGYAMAQVTGACVNCHTMHNSQNASAMVQAGTGSAWNPGTVRITGGGTGQQDNLLVSDCLGCHSATNNTTTKITFGGDDYPIVYNMGGSYPTAIALAGGNFALNAGGADIYGHNVFGISNIDSRLTTVAPGNGINAGGCSNTCHHSLALDDATTDPFRHNGIASQGSFNGCRGCHNKLGHHKRLDPSYRYLGGHGAGAAAMEVVCGDTLCDGSGTTFEDVDWELTKGPTDHNFYAKQDDPYIKESVGYFCTGCHGEFHSMGSDTFGPDPIQGISNGGDDNTDGLISKNSGTSPWLRHPTNVNIPFDSLGEYQAMNGIDYSTDVPVAQDPLAMGTKDTIQNGDQVMCLSCHRAHASQYADALRFDYSQMIAHNGTDLNTGCFYCHRSKDF